MLSFTKKSDSLPLSSFKLDFNKPCSREYDIGDIGAGTSTYPTEK
jgi:hypothetical protein